MRRATGEIHVGVTPARDADALISCQNARMAVGKESAPGAAGGERDDTVHHPRVDENITAAVPRRPDAATDSAFVPGDTVAGRYYIKRFIAFGGMGEVYEAEDLVLRQ